MPGERHRHSPLSLQFYYYVRNLLLFFVYYVFAFLYFNMSNTDDATYQSKTTFPFGTPEFTSGCRLLCVAYLQFYVSVGVNYCLTSFYTWPHILSFYIDIRYFFASWYLIIFLFVLILIFVALCECKRICWILIEVIGCQEVKWLFCYNHKLFYLVARGLIEI